MIIRNTSKIISTEKKAEVKKIIYQPIINNYLLPIAFLLFIEHQPEDGD